MFHVARELKQFADLANLLTNFVCPRSSPLRVTFYVIYPSAPACSRVVQTAIQSIVPRSAHLVGSSALLLCARAESVRRPCGPFPRMAAAREPDEFRVSFVRQLQVISPQNVVQQRVVDLCLRHQLLNAREILVPANARRNGNDVFRTKAFCRYSFEL